MEIIIFLIMKTLNRYKIFLCFFIFISCNQSNEKIKSKTSIEDSSSIDVLSNKELIGAFSHGRFLSQEDSIAIVDSEFAQTLRKEIVNNGSLDAYQKLSIYLMQFEIRKGLLPYSLVMSDKYHYPKAYFDVFSIYVRDIYPKTKDKADLENGLKYLYKAIDLEESNALSTLGYMYLKGEYVEKDSVLAKKYFEKLGMDFNSSHWKRLMKHYYNNSQ